MTLKEQLLQAAIEEWNSFGNQEITGYEKKGDGTYKQSASGNLIPVFEKLGHRETENPYYLRVGKYWNALNLPYNGKNDRPWSAAFISYLMKSVNLKKTDFLLSDQHSKYIRKAIVAMQNSDTTYGFWGYRITAYSPEPGDLVCYARGNAAGAISYDTASDDYESHCDLVIAKTGNVLRVIGGNVEDSVTMKHLDLDHNGMLADKSKNWFAVLKNRLKDLVVTDIPQDVMIRRFVVTGDGVRLRSYPAKEEKNIIDSLNKNDEVDFIEWSGDQMWGRVKYKTQIGWISALYLKPLNTVAGGTSQEAISDIVAGSTMVHYQWKDRGKAPLGYYQGMALMFGRLYLRLKQGEAIAVEIAKAATGNPQKDSLTYYNDIFESFGMDNEAAGTDTLRHCFVMMIGLGLRESSGKHCVGRDTTATNMDAETAEAGLFQTSYNARSLSPLLPTIFNHYKTNPDGLIAVFSRGVTCSNNNWANFGVGDGREFQRLSKECPGFAVEFTAVAMRNTSRHWGPVITRKVEIRPECDTMLLKVQHYIDQHQVLVI